MDNSLDHLEMTVRRRDPAMQTKDTFRYHLLFAVSGALLLAAIVAFYTAVVSFLTAVDRSAALYTVFLPPLLLFAAAAVCFFSKDNMRIEYDYSLEDGKLIVAKIKNLSSRKEVLNLPLNQLKRIEPFSPERFAALSERKLNFTLNPDEPRHLLFCTADGTPTAVVLELNEAFQKALRKAI